MNLGNRFHAVRTLGPDGLGPRYVLERRRAQWPTRLVPDGPEWVRLPNGRIVPAIHGGVGWSSQQFPHIKVPSQNIPTTVTQTTKAMATAYVYATSGDAIGWRILPTVAAKNLQTVYIYVTAMAAAAPQVTFELRNAGAKPGTLVSNGSLNFTLPNTNVTRWHMATYSSLPTLAAGTEYWLALGNTDGAPTVNTITLAWRDTGGVIAGYAQGAAVTDGFSANPSISNIAPLIVLGFDDGTWWGRPFTANANPTSDQNKKGWYVGGFTEQIKCFGAISGSSFASTQLDLFASGTAPNGSPIATGTAALKDTVNVTFGYEFAAAQTLAKATAYRVTFDHSSNFSNPVRFQIGTVDGAGSVADLEAAMWGGGLWYYALAAGPDTSWVDNAAEQPAMALLIEDQIAVETGGGLLTHPGMVGRLGG